MNGYADTDASNRKARTIAVMNIPDTVTAARVEKLVASFGALTKFILRPDHAGAIVEFAEEKNVGSAEFGLANTELEGYPIKFGTVPELLKQKPFQRTTKLPDQLAKKKEEEKKKSESAAATNAFGGLAPRQAQGSRGTGRRGGLGFKRAAFGAGRSTTDDGDKGAGGKSNDYFKNLIAGVKKEETGKPAAEEKMEV
jgi:squamous cell carcinoma antigen recognized by T-cells 3